MFSSYAFTDEHVARDYYGNTINNRYIPAHDISAGTVTVSYPPYTLWKVSVSQNFGKYFKLTLAVDNVFNYKPRYYYLNCPLTDGANFLAGLSVDLY